MSTSKWSLFSKGTSQSASNHVEAPPPYTPVVTDDLEANSSQAYEERTVPQTTQSPSDQTPLLGGNSRYNATSPFVQAPSTSPSYHYFATNDRSPGILGVLVDPSAYLSLAYFLIVAPLDTSFAFVWVSALALTALPLMIIPPVGILLFWGLLVSTRMLARFELILQSLFNVGTPTSQYFRHPLIFPQVESPSFWTQFFAPFNDSVSWSAVLYFLLVKPIVTTVTVTITAVMVSIGVPLILPIPLVLLGVRTLGKWEREMAVAFLAQP